MKKLILIFGILLVLVAGLVSAHEHNKEEAKQIIDSEVDCDKLTDEQLEMIGEYYMEQMHPGEAHELMDEMMGGESSESLKQMHIQMSKGLYCNEDVSGMMGSGGMMGMMPMMINMMGGQTPIQTNTMQGMMGNWGYGFGYWNFINILYTILLIGLIILVYLWILKLWKNLHKKNNKTRK